MSQRDGRGCFKLSCFGCLTMIGIGVGLVFLFGAVQLSTDWGEPTPERADVQQDLPPVPPLPELTSFPGAGELPSIALQPLPDGTMPADVAGGRLLLDLSMGEFTIEPGEAGQPIRVEADYDSNSFNLEETFTTRDDGTWTYEVSSKARGGWMGILMRGGVQDGDNRVRIIVPRGQPLEIGGTIGVGESEIDLGGLWVRAVDLDLGTGDHLVEFSEPLPIPMEHLALEGSMGALEVQNVGNASPSTLEVEASMGELLVDLEGPWRNDATLDIQFGMGACKLWLPDTARVELGRVRVKMGERRLDLGDQDAIATGAPTLTLEVDGSMGELTVKH